MCYGSCYKAAAFARACKRLNLKHTWTRRWSRSRAGERTCGEPSIAKVRSWTCSLREHAKSWGADEVRLTSGLTGRGWAGAETGVAGGGGWRGGGRGGGRGRGWAHLAGGGG